MAWEIPKLTFTLEAAADLSGDQYNAVTVDTAGKAAIASAGGVIIGILQNKPNINQAATIEAAGISKFVIGTGGVTAADALMVEAGGALITAVATNREVGICLVGGAAGEIGSMLVKNGPNVA